MSEFDLSDDEPIVDEDLGRHGNEDQASDSEISVEEKWKGQDLGKQCEDVLNLLTNGDRRWDDSIGKDGIPVLEKYKKEILATRRDPRDIAAPTALHILAKSTKEFSAAPKDARTKLVKFLLEQRNNSLVNPKIEDVAKEELILAVATKYDNYGFVGCIEDCMGRRFRDLLRLQDGEGKNCLHHLCTWVLEGVKGQRQRNRMRFLQWAKKLVPKAGADTFAAAEKTTKNTPIHLFMDLRLSSYMQDDYVEMVQHMVREGDHAMRIQGTLFNGKGESPILYGRSVLAAVERAEQQRQENDSSKSAEAPKSYTPGKLPVANTKDIQLRPGMEGPVDARRIQKGNMAAAREPPSRKDRDILTTKGPISKNDKIGDAPSEPVLRKLSIANHAEDNPSMLIENVRIPPPNGQQPLIQDEVLAVKKSSATPSGEAGKGMDREPKGKSKCKSTKREERSKACEEILNFLEMHYLRTRSDLEARELIYGKAALDSVKNLYFDAKGEQEARKMTDLLGRMSIGGFAITLAYVHLPTVWHNPPSISTDKPSSMIDRKAKRENPSTGRTELISVFDKLHQLGVRNILRLCVEDRREPSHMDAAIERALQGRESIAQTSEKRAGGAISVETWDWRKPDLITDVISFAAPTVEHVHLYWSGNQAVLRAWDCNEGIPRLHATTKLKTVTVHAAPGLETRERMDESLKRFEKEILKKTDGKVEVKIFRRMDGLLANLDVDEKTTHSTGEDSSDKQHVWVETMDTFRGALYSLLNKPGIIKPERIKVALIDDGVNLSILDTYRDTVEATGFSFCPREPSGSERPWHCSSAGHGTIMANMIVRVNPWVKLYVMRVQHGLSHDGGSTISAGSAARAIYSAVHIGVNIISMSWTIKNIVSTEISDGTKSLTANQSDIKKLEDAIDQAKAAKVLMFCSASDNIKERATDYLPYQRQPDYIFRIGAALSLGQRDPHTKDTDNVNYYFPGNQVAEAKNPRSASPAKYHDGSSVSTALAAGLASLIMYCASLAEHHFESGNPQEKSEFAGLVKRLQEQKNMKQALNNIRDETWTDPKYLPVWLFYKGFNGAKDETKWHELKKLVTWLAHRIE